MPLIVPSRGPSKPPRRLITPSTVDPRWHDLWSKLAFVVPFWDDDADHPTLITPNKTMILTPYGSVGDNGFLDTSWGRGFRDTTGTAGSNGWRISRDELAYVRNEFDFDKTGTEPERSPWTHVIFFTIPSDAPTGDELSMWAHVSPGTSSVGTNSSSAFYRGGQTFNGTVIPPEGTLSVLVVSWVGGRRLLEWHIQPAIGNETQWEHTLGGDNQRPWWRLSNATNPTVNYYESSSADIQDSLIGGRNPNDDKGGVNFLAYYVIRQAITDVRELPNWDEWMWDPYAPLRQAESITVSGGTTTYSEWSAYVEGTTLGGNKTGTGEGSITVTGGSATAERTRVATAEGAVAVTGGDADTRVTRHGTGAASIAVTGGSATGARTVSTTAEGSVSVAGGDAAHSVTRVATGETSISLVGDSTGQRTAIATAESSVSITGDASAGGQGNKAGTGAASIAVVGGDATAQRTALGTGAGSLSLAGDATAQRTALGTGAGDVLIAGDATAARTGIGAGEATISVTVNATGQRTVSTTAEGAITLTADAFGQGEGNRVGTGSGSVNVVGGDAATHVTRHATAEASIATSADATGQRTTSTTAEGAVSVTGNAVGGKQGNQTGTGEASISITADATAQRTTSAIAEGAVSVAGDASARADRFATAEGSITVTTEAFGNSQGQAAGVGAAAITVSGEATGQVTRLSTGEASINLTADASGQRTGTGAGATSVTISGDAIATHTRTATAEGAVTIVTSDPITQRTAVGVASGSISVLGGNAISRSDTSNFNFDAFVGETWAATLEETYDAESVRRWATGEVHL